MYYEERVINGVLHSRTQPTGEWQQMSPEQLTMKLLIAQANEKAIRTQVENLSDKVDEILART